MGIRGKELRDQIYGPIVPLHEDPSWTRWARASGKFTRCFGREPKEGDLLRWEHVRMMYGPEMNEIEFSAQIEAWKPTTARPAMSSEIRRWAFVQASTKWRLG
jgi:hypothetical protein